MTTITSPITEGRRSGPQPARRPSPQLIADGVIATYIRDISARRRRPARVVELRRTKAPTPDGAALWAA